MDAFPILSQLKSAIQVASGDKNGAKQTQINFSRRCPVVSQIRSIFEAVRGNGAAARETQEEFGRFLFSVAEGSPIIGHAIGIVFLSVGRKDDAELAMKAAYRTTGVVIGGSVGFLGGGPVGASAGGAVGGVFMDCITTVIDSAVNKTFTPSGILTITEDVKNPVAWFESTALIGIDALACYMCGKGLNACKKSNAFPKKSAIAKMSAVSKGEALVVEIAAVVGSVGSELCRRSCYYIKEKSWQKLRKHLSFTNLEELSKKVPKIFGKKNSEERGEDLDNEAHDSILKESIDQAQTVTEELFNLKDDAEMFCLKRRWSCPF